MGQEQNQRSGTSQKEDSEEPDSYFVKGENPCQKTEETSHNRNYCS